MRLHASLAPPHRRIKVSAAALVLALLGGAWAGAGEPLPPNTPDGLFAFANQLRGEGDYYRAITEYRRLLFHFPNTRHADAARKAVADCYLRAERWKDAEGWLTQLEVEQAGQPLARWATLQKAGARLAAGHYDGAAAVYDEFLTDYPNDPQAGEARWRRAWSYLLGHRFEHAKAAFEAIAPPSPHVEAARALARECRRLATRRRKSPLLAGILGIVPGLGHFYVGRYKDGLVSLAFNGLIGWGAASAFSHGAKAAGAVMSLFGANFYLGSIFGGVNWAHRTNRAVAQRQIDRLRERHGM